ncbi:MAG: hypothetical protein AAGA56_16845, partial [Myxococcota bacterium]
PPTPAPEVMAEVEERVAEVLSDGPDWWLRVDHGTRAYASRGRVVDVSSSFEGVDTETLAGPTTTTLLRRRALRGEVVVLTPFDIRPSFVLREAARHALRSGVGLTAVVVGPPLGDSLAEQYGVTLPDPTRLRVQTLRQIDVVRELLADIIGLDFEMTSLYMDTVDAVRTLVREGRDGCLVLPAIEETADLARLSLLEPALAQLLLVPAVKRQVDRARAFSADRLAQATL